ncbi:MAG: ADP-ribosylglycohydrolase family protein [Acidobacteriota bacterium]
MESRGLSWILIALVASLVLSDCRRGEEPSFREISIARLRDKIEGGWAGQMIGVSFGAPTEFRYLERTIPRGDLPEWTDESIRNALDQDDLYVEMTFARVLDEKGLDATTEDFGNMFKESRYRLWHANLAARRALRRGVSAVQSGTPRYNAHANDIDFQIESDFIGLMSPGLPQAATDLSLRVGRVMNSGDGILGGVFVNGMYAAAFFESDPRRVVEAGLASLPPASPYARVIRDVLQWAREDPTHWRKAWRLVEEKWNGAEACPAGALRPFNIDAKLNGAYIALGLLYGGGDLSRTLEISTRCGQDSDCNPSNAAGIVGVMVGYKAIPERWKRGIEPIADERFAYTDFSFRSISESTEKRAIALVERHGGRRQGDTLLIPTQKPVPPELRLWNDFGSPMERVGTDDPRWSWTGPWTVVKAGKQWWQRDRRAAAAKGAEATVTFQGTGAIVVGPYLPDGGRVDVYLDGHLERSTDVYSDEEEGKGTEDIWHRFGLEEGQHTVRLVVQGEPFSDSRGSTVAIEDLVVFR